MERAQTAIAFVEMHRAQVALGVMIFVGTLLFSLAMVAFLLLRLPPGYLQSAEEEPFWPGRPQWQRVLARIGKNLLGVVLVAVGILLSLPGIPGQGVLTIVIGVMLLDIPGKRRIERKVLGRRRVLASINRLRARFGRAPLEAYAPS
jgi:UPF0716 family protein affecting phage T7 exclusion